MRAADTVFGAYRWAGAWTKLRRSKRHQVERQRQWATAQVPLATAEGVYPEAERMKQLIRECDTELQGMDQIEAYRRDEAHETRGIPVSAEN